MKKRHIVLGLLALEVATLPMAAHVVHKSDFKFDKTAFAKPQHAIHVKLHSEPGMSRYMVSANAPFNITSQGSVGRMEVRIRQHGKLNGNNFGKNTQSPGPSSSCVDVKSEGQQSVYISERGTVAGKGDILSKTVLVEVRYDSKLSPELKILTQKKSENILPAQICAQPIASSS